MFLYLGFRPLVGTGHFLLDRSLERSPSDSKRSFSERKRPRGDQPYPPQTGHFPTPRGRSGRFKPVISRRWSKRSFSETGAGGISLNPPNRSFPDAHVGEAVTFRSKKRYKSLRRKESSVDTKQRRYQAASIPNGANTAARRTSSSIASTEKCLSI